MSIAGESYSPKEGLSIIDKPSLNHNTQKQISNDLGWSTGKVAMADVVMKRADEETKERLRNNVKVDSNIMEFQYFRTLTIGLVHLTHKKNST